MKNYTILDSTSKSLLGKNFSVDITSGSSYSIPSIHPTMSFRLISKENGVIVLLNSNLKIIGKQI